MRLSVIHTGCPASAWPRMASALVDVNRLPLRRTGVPGGVPLRSTVTPCAPPLIDVVVTEIAVFTALIPSTVLGPMLLPETTRPKVDDPDVRSEEHTSELQSPDHIVWRLLVEKK